VTPGYDLAAGIEQVFTQILAQQVTHLGRGCEGWWGPGAARAAVANHIKLVIPLEATGLRGFQTMTLLWQHHAMYWQLWKYLTLQHGADWPLQLPNIRRRTAQAAQQRVSPLPRKRCQEENYPPKLAQMAGPLRNHTRSLLKQAWFFTWSLMLVIKFSIGALEANGGIGVKARLSPFGYYAFILLSITILMFLWREGANISNREFLCVLNFIYVFRTEKGILLYYIGRVYTV
jgi:hypothetical protein